MLAHAGRGCIRSNLCKCLTKHALLAEPPLVFGTRDDRLVLCYAQLAQALGAAQAAVGSARAGACQRHGNTFVVSDSPQRRRFRCGVRSGRVGRRAVACIDRKELR